MEPPPDVAPQAGEGKNIVVCSDGTGNTYTGTPSNVRRLHQLAVQDGPRQVARYYPGVGSGPRPANVGRLKYARDKARAIAYGEGVIENLTKQYTFVVDHYEPGDRLLLFGFSRGAFTVRALAGVLHVCGLVPRGNERLIAEAVDLYQTSEQRIVAERRRRGLPASFGPGESTDHASFDLDAVDFKARFARPCAVDFLGIWDTVKAYGWLQPISFPALRHNASVRAVRHAVALHEKRAVFKMTGWGDVHRCVKEVWFAGDHSDVGGGHKKGNSPLTDAALRWMLGEATDAGLQLRADAKDEVKRMERSLHEVQSAAPRSRWWRGGYYVWDSLPREELNNCEYPPHRHQRVFSWDGGRKPRDHAVVTDPGAVYTTLLVHYSLASRIDHGDPRFARTRLERQSAPCPGAAQPRMALQTAHDAPIRWTT